MISYKVLIILTFTINISHSKYSEEQILKEHKICVATDAGVIPFDAQIEKKLNESDINKQKEIHGETLLGKDKIREYLNQYSNACVQFDSDNINPPVLSPEDYCNALMRERKCIKKLVAYLFLNSKFMI
ncbi:uncharacterized protein LOC112595270 isoform X3 [Melanaphis sacchari]|uniref:uncharacterized protein LOC112595270 isoform X3 n=1 Tax=Melanaphis sacchari TaxID=742174 RepID=UPI000DC14EC8|nr:uncharacterized protein LOC112595270 isoform X3 [Melanaphis sacchari]